MIGEEEVSRRADRSKKKERKEKERKKVFQFSLEQVLSSSSYFSAFLLTELIFQQFQKIPIPSLRDAVLRKGISS